MYCSWACSCAKYGAIVVEHTRRFGDVAMKQFRTIDTLFEPTYQDAIAYWSDDRPMNLDWFSDIATSVFIIGLFLLLLIPAPNEASSRIADHATYTISDLNSNVDSIVMPSLFNKEKYTLLVKNKPTAVEYALWLACLEAKSNAACNQLMALINQGPQSGEMEEKP
jgi:hypothetical protein